MVTITEEHLKLLVERIEKLETRVSELEDACDANGEELDELQAKVIDLGAEADRTEAALEQRIGAVEDDVYRLERR